MSFDKTASFLIKTVIVLIVVTVVVKLVHQSIADDMRKSDLAKNNPYLEQRYMEENGLIKLNGKYFQYGVKEHGEVLPITKALDAGCRNDECKIKRYFHYVTNIEYKEDLNNTQNSVEVIMKGRGDCDEKSYLFASMLLQNGYESLLIYTNSHAFVGVNIPHFEDPHHWMCYYTYKGKKYYLAETTSKEAQIGAFNGIDPKEYEIIFDVNAKKEIPLGQVAATIYQ